MANKTLTLPVTGMTCANCATNVERNVRKLDGVQEANVNFASEKVLLTYDPAVARPQEVIDRIHRAGYEVPTTTSELADMPSAAIHGATRPAAAKACMRARPATWAAAASVELRAMETPSTTRREP